MEGGQISRQPFARPEIDAMLDDDHSDNPFHYFLASAFLVRLDQDEDFAADLSECTIKSFLGRQVGQPREKEAMPIAFPALHCLACLKNKPPRQERLEEPAVS
jgi:hypothetical protein